MNAKFVGIVSVIVAVIVLMSFIGGSASTLRDSANSLYLNCSAGGVNAEELTENLTTGVCSNSSDANVGALTEDLPLITFFSGTGIALLVVMAGLLLLLISFVLKRGMNK